MDAVKFLKEADRMCDFNDEYCKGCPNEKELEYCFRGILTSKFAETNVERVEKWSAEHLLKTRADVFKEMFPNGNAFVIKPCEIDDDIECNDPCECENCKSAYWNAPAPDGF